MKINVSLEVTPEQLMKIAPLLMNDSTAAPAAPAPQIAPPAAMPQQIAAAPAAPVQPVVPAAAPTPAAVAQMFAQPAPAPAPQQAPPTIPAQTAPAAYTTQQLSVAARPLVEMGRQQELMQLLAKYSAASVADLPENQRAAFAADLRAMGGQI